MADEAMRPLIIEEDVSLMLHRDLVERYGVRNERLMRELLRHSFRNTASLLLTGGSCIMNTGLEWSRLNLAQNPRGASC